MNCSRFCKLLIALSTVAILADFSSAKIKNDNKTSGKGRSKRQACQNGGVQSGTCGLCLVGCRRDDRQTEFLPKDGGTLLEGIHVFPSKSHILLAELEPSKLYGDVCPFTSDDASSLVDGIFRAVKFYEKNYKKLNRRTDGGVGLSILGSQLENILGKIQGNSELSATLENLLISSKSLAPKIFEMATRAEVHIRPVHKAMEIMGKRTRMIRGDTDPNKPWKSPETIPRLTSEFKERIGNEPEVIYPHLDFQCIVSVVNNCDLPHVCAKLYFSKDDVYSQYMLMHQILLLGFAEQHKCFEKNPSAFNGWDEFRDRLCAKAYLEAEFIEEHSFPARWRDLFSEQVAFCGLAGYPNFFRREWLHRVLSWQTNATPGCFPDIYSEGGEVRSTDVGVKTPVLYQDGRKTNLNCLIHLTSVSLAALTMNLRYMVDNCAHDIFERTHVSM